MKLEVHQLEEADVYKDIARIHSTQRNGLAEGQICKLSVNGKSRFLAARGLPDCEKGWVRLDEITRSRLGLDRNNSYEFDIVAAGAWDRFWWAYQASDPASRIAARLALWSVALGATGAVLGVAGVILGAWSLCITLNSN